VNKDELRIETPCQADWTSMSLRDKSRFCADCKKVVWDLSRMTESEARALMAGPRTEGLCVRYLHDEMGTIRFLREANVVPAPALVRAKRALVAAAAVALPMSLTACMGAAPPRAAAIAPPPPVTSASAIAPATSAAPTTSAAPAMPVAK
jgi:hypothetical protein